MTTVILVGLIVVLLVAAAYVGVLLLRRSRTTPAVPEPDATERPRTVADLVKRRTSPEEPDAELAGDELFVPVVPRQDGAAVPDAPAEPPSTSPQPATPAGGLEIGDAPWRRAARMSGAEPGGRWETAPLPVVAEPTGTDAAVPASSSSVVIVSRAAPAPTAATLWHELDAMRAAVRSDPATREREEEGAAEPALVQVESSPWTEPATDAPEAVEEAGGQEPEPASTSISTSRPLSDPDLTPLMGIPIIRQAAETAPAAEPPAVVVPAVAKPAADRPVAPTPRTLRPTTPDDDEIVFLVPPTGSFPVVAPAVSGSAQPVWFRVVRRDGEAVPAAVVALLDGRGYEVDTTKTATDGGGELRAPHGGRFLMIVSADGYQPRAATLTVDEEPVELALLLPRSAAVSGSVRVDGETVRDARVVVRQDHDVVDEASTVGDGHYRFDDLAEGTYTVAATAGAGGAVARVSLAEGADVHVDLDLR